MLLEPKKKLELPPRARRILFLTPGGFLQIGTTSACAENTLAWPYFPGLAWNYLRVRGEYSVTRLFSKSSTELPPRARRIRYRAQPLHLACGTTSACAENTLLNRSVAYPTWNYLRVRGEYPKTNSQGPTAEELPPRARRIPRPGHTGYRPGGTTSACAENTHDANVNNQHHRNYLRVRGEYVLPSVLSVWQWELPPRARRILHLARLGDFSGGTTSACAENTGPQRTPAASRRNYLRVRGEYFLSRSR